ncbi:MAG: DNA-protecting protein DprA [Bacteroidetes bacterium]|nr:DNA-protecting protein DprA [Bacteroidota bacterium]
MKQNIQKFKNIPQKLLEISDPPKELYIEGEMPGNEYKFLSIIGSRKFTSYGKDVCESLIESLKGFPIVIISGLALGIDSIAHESAIKNGLKTIAIPGSGLSEKSIYPRTNFHLSRKILASGGCLISEFAPDFKATTWSFPRRNRIMAGLSDAVLLIEAEEKSGTLITARLAMEYNRDVLVVPGSIFSKNSSGTNRLIKDGAHPVLSANDILQMLGFKEQNKVEKEYRDCNDDELHVLGMLYEPTPKEILMQKYDGDISKLNMILTLLEIKGHIKETFGEIRKV